MTVIYKFSFLLLRVKYFEVRQDIETDSAGSFEAFMAREGREDMIRTLFTCACDIPLPFLTANTAQTDCDLTAK